MKNLQLINTIKIIISIIVVVSALGFLINKTSFISYFFQTSEIETKKIINPENDTISYTEKIDNFVMQEFNENQELTQYIQAKTYINYKNSPVALILPVITTYDGKGLPYYQINSDRAGYLNERDVKFEGSVTIKPNNGVGHHMKTEELFVNSETNSFYSNSKVNYYDKSIRIEAQEGIRVNTKDDKMNLIGYTEIKLEDGQTLNTKNLSVDRSEGREHYFSEFPTIYMSDDNKVSSEAMDLDMQKNILNLFGEAKIESPDSLINTRNLVIDKSTGKERYYSKQNTEYLTNSNKIYSEAIDINMKSSVSQLYGKVKILQTSGTIIDTKNLEINKSNGMEVYKTNEKIHYKSKVANIKATGMHYDASSQIMNLNGEVFGIYE
jgi:LPS export ABC transporter protein LptC